MATSSTRRAFLLSLVALPATLLASCYAHREPRDVSNTWFTLPRWMARRKEATLVRHTNEEHEAFMRKCDTAMDYQQIRANAFARYERDFGYRRKGWEKIWKEMA